MKILHLSTSDLTGGAARGAYWLHQALRRQGIDSHMLIGFGKAGDPSVSLFSEWDAAFPVRDALDAKALAAYPHRHPVYFSPASYSPSALAEEINAFGADIVHIHWVAGGFLMPEDLPRLQSRLIWTLRDMWAFTGGCHYSEGCPRYRENCGNCPVLESAHAEDITHSLWMRKQQAWQALDLHLVPVSRWMAECAGSSSLFKGRPSTVIHNGLSMSVFSPHGKQEARERLGLPLEKKIILFGALYSTQDSRKGFHYLRPALEHLARQDSATEIELLIFGATDPGIAFPKEFSVRYLGTIHDDAKLGYMYAAADVTVAPSTEDACPKVPIESMACGTPVVCFDATGMRDIVDHQENGYRAACFDPEDLARGILWVLEQSGSPVLSRNARRKAETAFALESQAAKYAELYRRILS